MKKRIAILISGQPRMLKICLPLYKQIFEFINPDYYIFNWDKTEGKYIGYSNNTVLVDKNKIEKIYTDTLGDNIKSLNIESNIESENLLKGIEAIFETVKNTHSDYKKIPQLECTFQKYSHIINYVAQHHCSDLCNREKNKTKHKYDLVIRLRTDLVFEYFYKQNFDINFLKKEIEELLKIVNEYNEQNRPLVFFEKIQITKGLINTSDKIYAGNEKGIDILTKNILCTWVFNLLQQNISSITGYETNHITPPIDQHFSILANIHFKNPKKDLTIKKEKDINMLMFDQVPFLRLFYPNTIVRYNYNLEDTYTDLKNKNLQYLANIETNKNLSDNLAKKEAQIIF